MKCKRLFFFSFLLLIQTRSVFLLKNKTNFHIGALIPYLYNTHINDLFGFKCAIDLAVETIHNSSLLQGHRLIVHYKDTKLKPHLAIESLIAFKNMNSSEAIRTVIIGPSRSLVASYTARLATLWGPLQVSYGASTPELLDGSTYPRFLTIVPTSNSLNKAAIEMLNYFKWKRVGLVYDIKDKDFILPTMNKLQVSLNSGNFNIMVEEGISVSGDGKQQIIKRMKDKDVRIVIALFNHDDIGKLMCEAYHQRFYGPRIIWITYLTQITWRDKEDGCNASELRKVTNGMFVFDFLFSRTDNKKTISGLTVDEFNRKISYLRKSSRTHPKIPLAFDTTWLAALALNASLEDAIRIQTMPHYDREFTFLEKIRKKMMEIDFEGITGNVKFNKTERFGTVIIRQERNGRLVDIFQHHTRSNVLTFVNNRTATALLEGNYVRDGPLDVYEVHYFSPILSIIICIVCSIGIIVAVGLYYFNFKNREIRYIKMSSPHLNNIIILGGLLCYIKVILDTLDSRIMSLETYGILCNIRVWIMSLGFTTAFGAMFSKTWRVHRIFTASQNFRRAVIKNFHLYGLLVGLLAVDITLLTLWMIFSPYKYDILNLPDQIDEDRDEILHPSIYHCTSKHSNYFLITTFCYKGLLLIFGIFLAWETRNIEIKALNDSKYIGMSVYNVVILSVVGVLIASLMAGTNRYDLYLALMSVVVILCAAATLGIVFLPKILGLQRILNSTANERESSYTANTYVDTDAQCCCCENCKCRCRRRSSSIHVSNKFLASQSQNRRKSSTRNASMPSISVTKPNVSVRIDARVSLSTCREGEEFPSPDESPRVGFLGVD